MKAKKLLSVLMSALLLCSAAVVPVSAAEVPDRSSIAAEANDSKDENSVKGTFFFDMCGNWNPSDRISFYVWAKTDKNETRYLYKGEWSEVNSWGLKKTFGTPVEGKEGVVESPEIEFVDGWDYGVIFYDMDTGEQSINSLAITKGSIGKTIYLFEDPLNEPMDGPKDYYASFDKPDTNTPDIPVTDPDDTTDRPVRPDTPDKPAKPHDFAIGDADGDGKISAKDSMLIQRYAVNLKKLDDNQLKAADVDGDGKVTNKDAIIILRYTINIDVDYPVGMATYYFMAPDSFFEKNDKVGCYYWQPEEPAPWPGLEMTPAPEVGKNVFKCTVPYMDKTGTIIFNDYVDPGNPSDQYTHQTVNINTEGYIKEVDESEIYDSLDNFYGMIYVCKQPYIYTTAEFPGVYLEQGEWFSIDPEDYNYYKNYKDYYGTYGLNGE